ncbi:MAG: FAD-dependent oxidoreductase [Thermodesulfobacteriota bacterium]|nr:FAD-dependent oxidoreductase [Thermodesulfobacteriota bacterium]
MAKHLVLVGGGHAHMVTLANLHKFIERGHRVTVIGPSPYHYYSGMGPGMLSRSYSPEQIRFATRHVVEKQGGTFLLGRAVRVDGGKKTIHLQSGETIAYDVVSFNVGSYVPRTIVTDGADTVFAVKPIERLIDFQKHILDLASRKETTVGIIGGGPAAAEVAGNLWRLARDHGSHMVRIQVFSGENFMARFPEGIRKRAIRSLTRREIEIVEEGFVKEVTAHEIGMPSGKAYDVDLILLALGIKPSPVFKDSGLPTGTDGGLLVNRYLQSPQYPEMFGGGDCIYFEDQPLDKVGVYAVRQNPVLYENLMASLEGRDLQPFDPGGDYLVIFNMGDNRGLLHKKGLVLEGRLAFLIKDYIDRRFMRKFQAIE